MTVVALMQPYFFPYIGYWQLIHAAEVFVVYDDVNYIKSGWVNRNRLLLDGAPHYFTLNLDHASPYKQINETLIYASADNKAKILGQWSAAYGKAPYFERAFPLLKEMLMHEQPNLALYLLYMIEAVCRLLGITTKIILSSLLDKDNDLHGQDKVLDICRTLGGKAYINAIGGQDLYRSEAFAREGMTLSFIKTQFQEYKQFATPWVPGLSIIDMLMFCDAPEITRQLNSFTLCEG